MVYRGQKSLDGAPVSSLLLLTSALLALVLSLHGAEGWEAVGLDASRVLFSGQIWRLVSSQVVWTGMGECILGSISLLCLTMIERQMGSNKFAGFIIMSSTFCAPVLLTASLYTTGFQATSGPITIIFSLFVLYYVSVPVIHSRTYGIMGMHFSDKSPVYLLGLQLMFCDGINSFFPALCGIVAGGVYRSDLMSVQHFRIPCIDRLLTMCGGVRNSGVAMPSQEAAFQQLQPMRRTAASATAGSSPSGAPTRRQRMMPANPSTAPASPLRVSDESLAILIDMGFARDDAYRVLAQVDNSVERASIRLLEMDSSSASDAHTHTA